jgi:hypothetical protein
MSNQPSETHKKERIPEFGIILLLNEIAAIIHRLFTR